MYRPASVLGLLSVLTAVCLAPDLTPSSRSAENASPGKKGKKYALLVGVQEYESKHLRSLAYAENDVRELAKELKRAGYEVVVLTTADADNPPTLENIEKHLDALLGKARKHDLLLVGLAGHGLQFDKKEDSYFCPVKARVNDPKSLLSMRSVYKRLEDSEVGVGLLLVDACRDDGGARSARKRGVDGDKLPNPPKGVAALFSCSAGQYAWETPAYKHGVFFHFVLEGLRGQAKDDDGDVTWAALSSYVSKRVARTVPELIGGGAKQDPFEMKSLGGISPLLVESPEMANSIKMKLVRIPAGAFIMGSEETKESVARSFDEKVENFAPENPCHWVTLSAPVFFGKCEVTVGQFAAFVKATGHRTDAEKKSSATSMNPNAGARHAEDEVKNADWRRPYGEANSPAAADEPVRLVSWDDARAFCAWLSRKEGKKYRLPTEAEWEYACRAGTRTRYHNGNDPEKLTEVANVPDATFLRDYKRRFPNKTLGYATVKDSDGYADVAPVGSFKANAWGLHDVHGNVWEWCSDWYAADAYSETAVLDPRGPERGEQRVIRGGCFM